MSWVPKGHSSQFGKEQKIARFFGCAWVIGILITFYFQTPFWSLMDDGALVQEAARSFGGKSLGSWVWAHIQGGFGWGMFRPLYSLFIYSFYGSFYQSYRLAYFVICVVNLTIFWVWGLLFERAIRQRFNLSGQAAFLGSLFFAACFLFPPHCNLFFFASIQERLILLFASALLYGILLLNEKKDIPMHIGDFVLVAAVLVLLSKASGIFIIPVMMLWLTSLFFSKGKDLAYLWLIICLGLIVFGFGKLFLGVRHEYTAGYDLTSFIPFLRSAGPRVWGLGAIGIVSSVIILIDWISQRQKKKSVEKLWGCLIWPLGLLSYLAVLIPWGQYAGYYFVPAGVFLIGSGVCVYGIFSERVKLPETLRMIFLILLMSLGSWFCVKKFTMELRQHVGTKKTIDFLVEERKISSEPFLIRMNEPCVEAADQMSIYLNKPSAVTMAGTKEDALHLAENAEMRQLFIVNKECPRVSSDFKIQKKIFSYPPWHIYEGRVPGVKKLLIVEVPKVSWVKRMWAWFD